MRSCSLLYTALLLSAGLFFLNACKWKNRNNKHTEQSVTTGAYISKKNLSAVKLGYCSPSLNAPYYMALAQSIQKNTESYGMQFLSADGQDDIAKQITAVEDLVASGVQVLILNPLDPKALVPAVNAAVNAGIPVFIIDSNIDPEARYTSCVQANNDGNGALIGAWMAKQMGNKEIEAAIISGKQGNPVGKLKRMGFVEGFTDAQLTDRGSSNLKIVAHGWGNWTNNGGVKAMEDILVAHPNINLLFAENDAMAMGALKVITEAGKADKILVAGVDGQKEADALIQEGKMGATALNSPSVMASILLETIVKYLNNEKDISRIIYTPAIVITKNNVSSYYDAKSVF